MAIEYGFELGEPATVDRVVGTLARTATAFGMSEPDDVGFGGPGTELRGGMLVSVAGSTPAPLPDPVERTFGIVGVLDVLFRFDRDSDSTAQRLDMMRLVVAVLADVPGDAVLEFAGEIVWLVRQGGLLRITSAEGYWTPELRALLPAHECAVLPNL
ncbi:hypothetical protein BLA60_01955 [Actinophytocola xinjiangensis]|uniref:Uncharacterized protein n=1 Tax=Actinophytocola xinjiangensis TaxID=485602 RepID=A0A7Z0WRE0_9PSEU|nr:SitI3 family protein [Actinophytocola xinjiangensis]OLF13966.1 hypothetical protein BLA60_01955 [Actinophytocola xinjiangensis]